MSNLKAQIQVIKQQLAVSNAETIARLKRLETELAGVHQALAGVHQAINDEGMVQQKALDQLLDLVTGHTEDLENRVDKVEDRLSRLEQDRPPAA